MNKEKEIEEMAEAIDKRLDEANEWIGSMNKGKGNWIAEGLFPTYRKADEVRMETVKIMLEAVLDDGSEEANEALRILRKWCGVEEDE